MSKLVVAAAQIECAPGDVEANEARHLEFIAEARAADVDLLLFPELSLTDYLLHPDCQRLARAADSDKVRSLAAAAGAWPCPSASSSAPHTANSSILRPWSGGVDCTACIAK